MMDVALPLALVGVDASRGGHALHLVGHPVGHGTDLRACQFKPRLQDRST